MKTRINASPLLETKFSLFSFFNKILVYQLGKDGLEIKKNVLARYSFNQYVDLKKEFRDSKFEHQLLRLATQILLHESLWEKVHSYTPHNGIYSKKDLKKLVLFYKRGARLNETKS